ncbi:phosphonate metabolism [Brucella intermedia LMG 3301]|uniref:Phosphonate metabolism n=1 Tax=Brucella intermedia LMG 3301 TaxID=641118 RepID=C4WHQ7_9HYPH|nr:phosphonate metabolism [Brucella intermedia LMG 3301]
MMLPSSPAFEGGLANPVTDAQSVFHAVMHAMANPGRIYPLAAAATPPQPLTPELGVIAATLLDHDATVWCDAAIAANEYATAWVTFHTGAPRVENADAAQFFSRKRCVAAAVPSRFFARQCRVSRSFHNHRAGCRVAERRAGLCVERPRH